MVDAFTKFVLIYTVKDTKTSHLIRCLSDVIKTFGAPRRVISDRGRAFMSESFQNFLKQKGITHHYNAVGLPRGNGQVERYNKTILDSLATMGADMNEDKWDKHILNIQLGINGTYNQAIGCAPSEALMGFRVRLNSKFEMDTFRQLDVTGLRQNITRKIRHDQQEQKRRFDAKRCPAKQFQVGDLVLVKITSIPATGANRKLLPKWTGPFKVTKILDNDRYQVQEIPGMQRSQIPYCGVVGAENMKRWVHFINADCE